MNALLMPLPRTAAQRLAALIPVFAILLATLVAAVPALAGEGTVKTRALPRTPKVAQNSDLVIAVEMDFGDHLHAWPAADVKLPESVADFAIRTEIGPQTLDAAGKPVAQPAWLKYKATQYPTTKLGKVPDPMGGPVPLEVPLYSHIAVTYVTFTLTPDSPLGEQTINVALAYQACDDKVCFPPEDAILPVKITIVPVGQLDLGTPLEGELFKGFMAAQGPSTPTTTTAKPSPSSAAAAASPPRSASLFGVNLGTSAIALFLASVLAGALLNLTPCVLPVIPIKIMSLTMHAKSRRSAIILGLWMFAGVVAFWTIVGLPMVFINANLDPSQFIFGYWYITLSIGLVIALMGIGIMGLFNLSLPQSVYMVETKADSPIGSFFYGVFAAILGLPCFGLLAGGILAIASTLPPLSILAIFVGLGVGMGGPYLVLSIWPGLLKFIPRTGPASDLVKQVMGLWLIAAAAFFIDAGIKTLLKEMPYLEGSMGWWAVAFFLTIASAWLLIRTIQITRKPAFRAVFTVLALGTVAVSVLFARHTMQNDYKTHLARKAALAAAGTSGGFTATNAPAGVWLDYTPELLASLRAANRPVFLEFTANWCISCKFAKSAVLDPMAQEFADRSVVLLEVSCDARNGPGSALLRDLGRTGIPTWAVYAPGKSDPHFLATETPTPSNVRSELDALGIHATAVTSRLAPADK
jgi:thiol:disulfide interchange protein DsbD